MLIELYQMRCREEDPSINDRAHQQWPEDIDYATSVALGWVPYFVGAQHA